jgi:hypothetical protein
VKLLEQVWGIIGALALFLAFVGFIAGIAIVAIPDLWEWRRRELVVAIGAVVGLPLVSFVWWLFYGRD